jgi:hypothetical protein
MKAVFGCSKLEFSKVKKKLSVHNFGGSEKRKKMKERKKERDNSCIKNQI